MVQIIQENRRPSSFDKFSELAGLSVGMMGEQLKGQREGKALEAAGIDKNLPREFQQLKYQADLQRELKSLDLQGKSKNISNEELQNLKHKQALELEEKRQQRPVREPKKTQASQPIDPEQLKIIESVRNTPEYTSASPTKKYQMLTHNGVSKENAQAEAEIEAKTADIENKTKSELRKEEIDFHKESKDYDETLLKNYQVSQKQIDTIKDVQKAVSSGNVKPSSLANIFKNMGKVGEKVANALLSGDEAVVQAAIPEFLEGRKELFGVRLSDADLKLLEDKLPSIGKSKEANEAILRVLKKYAKYSQLKYNISTDIKKNNKGLRPLGYSDQVEERYSEMIKPVRVVNPRTGNQIEIPAFELSDAIKAGATLVDE